MEMVAAAKLKKLQELHKKAAQQIVLNNFHFEGQAIVVVRGQMKNRILNGH